MFFTNQRDRQFFDLIEQAAANALEISQLLARAVDDLGNAPEHAKAAKELENKGDDYTHKVVELLNRIFVTPLEREDIFALAMDIDDVTDLIEAAMSRMALYGIKDGNGHLRSLARVVGECTEQLFEGVTRLRKRNLAEIRDYAVRINELENEADAILRQALGELFQGAPDVLHVIKMKEIYETLEAATDSCEDVANTLESVVMRHA